MPIGESPAHDVARHVLARIPGLTTSPSSPPSVRVAGLFPTVKGVSALAIMFRNVTGEQETPFVEGGNGHRDERPEVQCFVRGDKDDPQTAEALIRAVAGVLNGQGRDELVSGYYDCRLRGSGVQPLPDDDNGFPEFVATFGLKRDTRRLPLFTGAAPIPGAIDAAFLASLSSSPQTRRGSFWQATGNVDDFLWWAAPIDWLATTPSFSEGFSGRTPIAFQQVMTLDFVTDGEAHAYAVFRSTVPRPGTTSIKTL